MKTTKTTTTILYEKGHRELKTLHAIYIYEQVAHIFLRKKYCIVLYWTIKTLFIKNGLL